jgi:predicted transcriptional regulator YheO
MNLDISAFLHMQQAFERFTMCETSPLFSENLRHRALDDIRLEIESYAITQNRQPNSLNKEQRNAILQRLQKAGLMQLRNAATTVSEVLGISRASVYNYLKEK